MANGATSLPRGFQKCKDCNAVGPACDVCHGTGQTHGANCQSCKGTGLEVHTTVIESCKG
jgi:DnaJ-class molecular chaperone